MDKHPIGEQERATLEALKEAGVMSHISEQRRLVVQAFLATTEPTISKELLYAVKRLDPMVSKGTVIKVLNAMVAAGMVTSILPERHPFVTRYAKAAPIQELQKCSHKYLVCKDCGEVITKEQVSGGMWKFGACPGKRTHTPEWLAPLKLQR